MSKEKKSVGRCRLCHAQAELSESHIIPKFLLRESGTIGYQKKFDVICYSHPEKSERHRQDGIKDYLMCSSCETSRLAPLERYARERFYDPQGPIKRLPRVSFIWEDINYTIMKLFMTSILWRMSLSEHKFYGHVQVGSRHEERMRRMLLDHNPMEDWRYGCNVGLLLYGAKPLGAVFSQPQRFSPRENRTGYRLMIAEMVWFYSVSNTPVQEEGGFLQQSGRWEFPAVEALAIPFVKEEIDRFRQHA